MQLGDATSSPDTGFSWGNLLNSLGSAVGSAANYALQYKQAQLQAQTEQARISAQTQQAQQAAQAQAMLRYNSSIPGMNLPSIVPGQNKYFQNVPATTNYLPIILIGALGLGAVLLISR